MRASEPARRASLVEALFYEGDDCLPWPHRLDRKGYGPIWVDGRGTHVHRVICEAVHGPAPTPLHHAAHSCHNTTCINGKHVGWLTPAGNAQERSHGRLDREQVEEIRQIGRSMPGKAIAALYGVSRATISSILTNKRWRSR
jgi:hypothetical protein